MNFLAYQLPHVGQSEQARYNENARLFNEYNNVERALCQKIVKAVDDAYLTALCNRQTNTIDATIPVILDYLFNYHGRVTPVMLQQEEKEVKEMFYNPTHPVDVIFNKVEDLLDFSIAAHADYTKQQLINIAYVIINNANNYQHYICDWSRLHQARKTWAVFKTHFCQAHQELRESGDLMVKETAFHSANLIQEVIEGVQTALLNPPNNTVTDTSQVITQMANNAAQQKLLQQMMAQMVQMMDQLDTIQQCLQSSFNSTISSNFTSSSSCCRQRTIFNFYC